jgi:O-antigen/teichoic acid export membrane protein
VLSEGLKGRGYPLAGTVGELVSLAWIAVALAVFVPLWGIIGAAVALTSSYVISMLLLLVIAARHGELESARGSLVSLPGELLGAVRSSARPTRAPLQESDRPARVS